MTTPVPTPTATATFDPEVEAIRSEWLADLRRGDIEQCDGVLASANGGFCCLGVLANGLKERHPEWLEANGFEVADGTSHVFVRAAMVVTDTELGVDRNFTGLPARLVELVGIPVHESPDDDPDYRKFATEVPLERASADNEYNPITLAALNDAGATFAEIADKIEEVLYK